MVQPVQTSSPLVPQKPVPQEKPSTLMKIAYYACLAFIALGAISAATFFSLAFLTTSEICLSISVGSLSIAATAYFLQDLFKQRFPKKA